MLLISKLTPPPQPSPMLVRPRLEQLIGALVERHQIVMISATAGSGKTAAIRGAIDLIDRPVAWLTLDRTESAPGRLLAYLEAALRAALPDNEQLDGVVVRALRSGIQQPEAAGILAETIGDTPVVLVLDDVERISTAVEAMETLERFLRYAPSETRVVLASRFDIPMELLVLGPGVDAVALPEDALAFTREEVDQLVVAMGGRAASDGLDEVMDVTGGWVIGVLLELWHAGDSGLSRISRRDLLDRYLSSQVLENLSEGDREFLVVTSIFDEVTSERATALGLDDAPERMVSLRRARLPLVWNESTEVMRCQPRFREHLGRLLQRRGQVEANRIRAAAGRRYAREGAWEQATRELLAAGSLTDALDPARRAIYDVIDRQDFALARRWLEQLCSVSHDTSSELTAAQIILALVDDDYNAGVQVVDAVARRGELADLATSSDRAAALMVTVYCGGLRLRDARAVLQVADGPELHIARYLYSLFDFDVPTTPRPDPVGGLMDVSLAYADYLSGRLVQLTQSSGAGAESAVTVPWQIMALCAQGRLDEAQRRYQDAAGKSDAASLSLALVAAELQSESEDREAARGAVTRAWRMMRTRGPNDGELLLRLVATKMRLRLDHDPDSALVELDRLAHNPASTVVPFIAAPIRMWRGAAYLMKQRDGEALTELRSAVDMMEERGLMLDLPMAGIYLAEAEWRAGDPDAADVAADAALRASRQLGSNHRMLQALSEFPNVVSRRLDSEVELDSPWRDIGRAIIVHGPAPVSCGVRIELREFGEVVLTVDGTEERMRIAKAYEILSFLLLHRVQPVQRKELLDVFFDGKNDQSTRAYLRQALYWIRRVIGDEDLILDGQQVQLCPDLSAVSDSMRFESQLSAASRLAGSDRADMIESALNIVVGSYLPKLKSEWTEARRMHLRELAIDARCDLAELRFAVGRYKDARSSVEQALHEDPYREVSWRLLMRIVSMFGDADAAIRVYRECESALAEIGVEPSAGTRRLLDGLRR